MRVETHYSANYRKEIIASLVDAVTKGSCKTIVGLRGVGLGPFVRFLHYHPAIKEKYLDNDDSYLFLFINIDELINGEQKTLLREFLRELKTHLLEHEVPEENYVKTEFLRGIETDDEQELILRIKNLLEVATSNDLKIIYLLQEFDEIAKNNSPLLNILYGLYFNYRPNLVFVFGVHKLPNRLRPGQETRFDYIFHNVSFLKPFTYDEFEDHYLTHIKLHNLKVSKEDLKVFYKYTGGLPSYGRLIENTFNLKDLKNLDERLMEHISNPRVLAVTKQLLADLNADEISTLKALSVGDNKINATSLKSLQDLGLVSKENKLFSVILSEDLKKLDEESTGLVIDKYTKKIFVDNVELSIYLSPIEFKFLEFLYDHKESVCDREEIIEYAWGGNPDGISDEAVDQLVSRLRSKLLAKTGSKELIKTVRGRGFTLD